MVMSDGPWREEKVKLSHSSLPKLCCLLTTLFFSALLKSLFVDYQPV